jgi:two-component sensor histidine kinase
MLQRLRAFRQMTTYLGTAMIAIIWCTVFYLAHEECEEAVELAARQGTNLARIFEEYIARVVGGADATLLALRELYQHDPQHFDILRLTRQTLSKEDSVVQFAIIGVDGRYMLGTQSNSAENSVDDRDYFRFQAPAKTDELYISTPVIGRLSGRLVFVLARRITTLDGSFGGLILAAIDILRLEKFYSSIDIGPEGAISLTGFDGILRARGGRDPAMNALVGKSVAYTRMFSLYRQSPSGQYWNFGNPEPRLDGVRRLISYEVVDGYPLIVAVGLAERDIFEDATSVVRKYYVIAVVLSACVIAAIGIGARRQATLSSTMVELEQSKRSLEEAIAELDHRVRNILARIAAVAKYTRQGSRSMDEFVSALEERIQSMGDAHALLSQNRWHGVSLGDLVRRQLAPYTTVTNTEISGPDITLSATATQAVAMVLQELVTNAVKHGSLSTPHGKVSVNWDRQDGAPRLVIAWRETNGQPITAPSHSSYGTKLIRGLIPRELGGSVDLVFAPEGLRCEIEIPLNEARIETERLQG